MEPRQAGDHCDLIRASPSNLLELLNVSVRGRLDEIPTCLQAYDTFVDLVDLFITWFSTQRYDRIILQQADFRRGESKQTATPHHTPPLRDKPID
jgi:hypothetical protein